jgi:acetyl-CoA C-acetyltransferase
VSQARAARAIAEGRFDKSLITVKNPDGTVALDHEEFPRPETTKAGLAELKTVFSVVRDVPVDEAGTTYGALIQQKYPEITEFNHIHHAGNSSGVVDGAAALLLASEAYMENSGMTPRARIVATANMGDCPTLMLNAPVPAAEKVLMKAGLTKDDIDVWEINEAFSVVAERFIRKLDLDREKVNINGGAMALGHPIGATGSILVGTALDELERQNGRYALITMCAAGGMAPAIIIERV